MLIRATILMVLLSTPLGAQEVADMASRDGWSVTPTAKPFDDLVEDARQAAGAGGLAVVTMAGPTEAAVARGIDVPGNRVIGLFNNDYAVRILRLSTPAMIEAPMRVYVTENADGTATLSYRLPSEVLAPYVADAPDLEPIGAELDDAFAKVADAATQ